jgi:hypothetical protein
MITLEANYSKKIGLPGYSSHQFSVTLKSELTDVSQVEKESARLYDVLQQSVDSNIQQIGYLPGESAPTPRHVSNGNGHSSHNDTWACSDKQRELVLNIVEEHKLDKNSIEKLAQDMFGKGVKALNKLEASGLIDRLLEQTGQKRTGRRPYQKAGGR